MFETEFIKSNHQFIAGVDEVGRGPLAGPVTACTVFVNDLNSLKMIVSQLQKLGVTDSKRLTSKKRLKLLDSLGIDVERLVADQVYEVLIKEGSFDFCINNQDHSSIDRNNILKASLLAMKESFNYFNAYGEGLILIDGNKKVNFDNRNIHEFPIIKGDQKSCLIAMASIIAKEYRDALMINFAKEYPQYGFESHAGYPTKSHKLAISEFGPCIIHRKSFRGVREYCER